MANIKANIKNIRKTARQHQNNKMHITSLRNKVKHVRTSKNQIDLQAAYKKIDSACAKGKIHQNKANRLKSRLAKQVSKK
ncbi:MAG: 30S ribosomal protein S20 [Mycoplasmataceae bacterium]|jgi:small subunit ribosomal protein S20|nr:30S ribosomal protein S20 [Mycoplasmataceae bacterium]